MKVLAYRKAKKLLTSRHLFEVTLTKTQLKRLFPDELLENWNSYPHPESTQRLGDAWVKAGETVGLAVPSVLASPEVHEMPNCEPLGFSSLKVEGPEPFPINSCLAPDVIS